MRSHIMPRQPVARLREILADVAKVREGAMIAEETLGELEHLWHTSPGDSAGPWTREEIHERAGARRHEHFRLR